MKELMLLIPLGGALLLTGCAGTESEFECNATTSDTCMTMEQANEKAKASEESSQAKPAAAGLPRLADGNFRTSSATSYPLPPPPRITPVQSAPRAVTTPTPRLLSATSLTPAGAVKPVAAPGYSRPVTVSTYTTSTPTLPGAYPRPLRKGEQTASLWIAPYVDAEDVYHQPATVLFVVTPPVWGQPRIN